MNIPKKYQNVAYVSSVIPVEGMPPNISQGANCQVFAYSILQHFGLTLPAFRSSELWADERFTTAVEQFSALDIMLYNNTHEPYGAHMGLYVGDGVVYHLSQGNGIPRYEKHLDLLKQEKYKVFIGAKRVLVPN